MPTSASFMIASGSSERGLSLVSTTKSLLRGRLAHQRPLGAVAVAAASEQRDDALGIQPARHRDHVLQGIGVWA
jgi:hypothetical protein